MFHPMAATHWARMRRGDLPDWDPLVLGGVPSFFQGLNTGQILSVWMFPFYLLPPALAVTLAAPLRVLFAGLLMWAYLRRSIGLGTAAALSGSVAWAFNGVFMAWLSSPIPDVALFLPACLLLVDSVVERPGIASCAGLGLVLGAQGLASMFQRRSSCWLSPPGTYWPPWPAVIDGAVCRGCWLPVWRGRWWPRLPSCRPSTPWGGSSRLDAQHVERGRATGQPATFALPRFWGSPVERLCGGRPRATTPNGWPTSESPL